MPETEQQDKTLSELVVKEAVQKGMDTPLRDSILEGVEESEGMPTAAGRRLPLAGALFGLGAAVGYLVGRESPDLGETSLEDVQEPEIIEDVVGDITEDEPDEEPVEETIEMEEEPDSEESSSRLARLLLVAGIVAGAVLLRRRLGSSDEEEWEPIEEFEPATDAGLDDEEDADAGEEMVDEQADEEEE